MAERVPVEMPKLAENAFAGTVTEAGAIKTEGAVSDNVTTAPPEGAAWESVTVQVAVAFELRVLGTHCKDDTKIWVCSETAALAEEPLSEAVTVAV